MSVQSDRVEIPQQFRMARVDAMTMFEKRSGRIAMIGNDGNVVVMDQTGAGPVKITRDAAQRSGAGKPAVVFQLPVWSPDASKLAFIETTVERPTASTVIEIAPDQVTIERGPDSQRFELNPGGPASSPGARQSPVQEPKTVEVKPDRVVIERGLGAGEVKASAVYVASADGRAPLTEVHAAPAENISYVDWSPDGKQLAFLSEAQDGAASVSLVAVDGLAKPRTLLTGLGAAWSWNPDGQASTLVARVDGAAGRNASAVSLLDARSDKVSPIDTRSRASYLTPHFSPDGNWMLTTVDSAGGRTDLMLADREGVAKRKLASFSGRIGFAWSPAGARVAYVARETAAQTGGALHVVDANTGEDKVIAAFPVAAFFWSPDGARIAAFTALRSQDVTTDFPGMSLVTSSATSIVQLSIVDVTTRNARKLYLFEPTPAFAGVLGEFDRFSRAMQIWSPDSKRIVFPLAYSTTSGDYQLIVEAEATGSLEPRVLGQGSLAVWSPR